MRGLLTGVFINYVAAKKQLNRIHMGYQHRAQPQPAIIITQNSSIQRLKLEMKYFFGIHQKLKVRTLDWL